MTSKTSSVKSSQLVVISVLTSMSLLIYQHIPQEATIAGLPFDFSILKLMIYLVGISMAINIFVGAYTFVSAIRSEERKRIVKYFHLIYNLTIVGSMALIGTSAALILTDAITSSTLSGFPKLRLFITAIVLIAILFMYEKIYLSKYAR